MKTLTHPLDPKGESIYLISDIHSNLPALEAVLQEIPANSLIVCAGDLLGYYLDPNEVCELLRSRSVLCIQGNHDKYVLGELYYPASRESKYRIIATRQVLTAANQKWLAALPDALLLEGHPATVETLAKPSIRVVHGSPRSVEEYVYPDTSIDFLTTTTPGFLVLGHTHHPMVRQAGALTLVNPGSVGQVRDRIPGASYASIEPFSGSVTFYRADYPVAAYQKSLEEAGVDSSMIKILSRRHQ